MPIQLPSQTEMVTKMVDVYHLCMDGNRIIWMADITIRSNKDGKRMVSDFSHVCYRVADRRPTLT